MDMLFVVTMLCHGVVCTSMLYFLFFKQKTAYEMRISDWSSDVCSSDLLVFAGTIYKNDSREEALAASRRWQRNGKTLWGCPCHQSNKWVLKSRFASLDLILIIVAVIHGCEKVDH